MKPENRKKPHRATSEIPIILDENFYKELEKTILKVQWPYKSEYKGTFRTVGDKEHAEIVRLYVEEGLGFNKIAEMLGRSSRTPLTQIRKHNSAVERSGFCPACRRFRSEYESRIALK
jgi:hypothetical protein